MPELRAYAKLTLSLRVTGVRADGFHRLDALMTTVSAPFDVVTVEHAAEKSLAITGPFAAGVPTDATNLAWRAAEACGATVAIRIEKHIPHGAGLGGGSADAAAVLVALGADEAVAAGIGADVPFCMRGGAAHVGGIGDDLAPVDIPNQGLVIASPHFGCSTPAVYRAWDALGGPKAEPNDLEPAAQHVEPRLAVFKQAVEQAAGITPFLAGSGSSYALVCDDPDEVAARVRARVDAHVWSAWAPAP